jgi:tripartite-type tricarboxylate transporter receptor subunit TctC
MIPRIALSMLLAALVLAPAAGIAQTYPDRPVKIVVPIGRQL